MTHTVPTNVITGFLGAGKTTAILALLRHKPANEYWAVLVNEFGEIGIDGALMSEQGALIKEVPGGCMCCTAGVPMSVGITALLRQKPDRLLIEPTGLGHPKQIIATLVSSQYAPYVDLKATIALLDARHLSHEKYYTNTNFNEQLSSADIIIANKSDDYTEHDMEQLERWLSQQTPAKIISHKTEQGVFPLTYLDVERHTGYASTYIEQHHHHHAALEPQFELPPGNAFIRKENKGQGYFSCGWLIGAEYQFDFDHFFSMLSALTAERVKAVVNTNKGCYAFNVVDHVVSVNEMSLEGFESRIEVLDTQLMLWDQLETVLLKLAGISK